MIWNEHSGFRDKHAVLSPSKHYWLNYSDDRVVEWYSSVQAAALGTELHDFAMRAINLGIKMPRAARTLNMYINDAIGFRMSPEQTLVYSQNAFGTADAISFRDNKLRIHDLKTGVTPAKMEQLEIYAALFFLEYKVTPGQAKTVLRIYQNDEIVEYEPEVDRLVHVMDRIVTLDKIIEGMKPER